MLRLLLTLAFSLAAAGAAVAQTVILVRHGEKADQSADPILSAAGQTRANVLANVLRNARLTHIFVSPLQRTRLTATPTAQAFGLAPVVVSLDGGAEANAQRVATLVRGLPSTAVILVVGHSNTVPAIGTALGQANAADMPECEFDRLTVLTLTTSAASPAVVGRYGAPSSCGLIPNLQLQRGVPERRPIPTPVPPAAGDR